jgi:hypothetical protein
MGQQAASDDRHVERHIQGKDSSALHAGTRMKGPKRMSFKIHRDQGLDRGRRSIRTRPKSEQRRDCSVPIWRGLWCVADSARGAKTSLATLQIETAILRDTKRASVPDSFPDSLYKVTTGEGLPGEAL